MKTLVSPFAILGLAAVAIIVVASCTMVHISPNQSAELYIGDPDAKPTPKYVELKDGVPIGEPKLRVALAKLKGRPGSICQITFLDHEGGTAVPNYCDNIDVRLKTKRVIKSAAAMNVGTVNSAANDPHLMYRVASPVSSDVSAVAALLK
jgi:hypothetical protein